MERIDFFNGPLGDLSGAVGGVGEVKFGPSLRALRLRREEEQAVGCTGPARRIQGVGRLKGSVQALQGRTVTGSQGDKGQKKR